MKQIIQIITLVPNANFQKWILLWIRFLISFNNILSKKCHVQKSVLATAFLLSEANSQQNTVK